MTDLTWWKIYLLAGMVAIGWRLGTASYRRGIPLQMYRDHLNGVSPRGSFLAATVSVALAVLLWPIAVGRWIWKWFK